MTQARASPSTRRLARRGDRPRSRRAAGRPSWSAAPGLYVRAALDDLEFPGTDAGVRARLEAELAERGPGAAARPPGRGSTRAAAASILPSNGRRIVRALEVIEITGRPFTATLPGHDAVTTAVQIGVECRGRNWTSGSTPRVDRMWAAGLVDGGARGWTRAACARAGPPAAPSATRRCSAASRRGDADEAREETVRATRRFARRQESWFRRDPRVRWLGPGGGLRDRAMAEIAVRTRA